MSEIPLNAPEWQMNDAYGDIGSERWETSVSRLRAVAAELGAAELSRETLGRALSLYEEGVTIESSLSAFAKCLGAKDSSDERTTAAAAMLTGLRAALETAARPLFAALTALAPEDPLWRESPLSHWQFAVGERQRDWHERIPESCRSLVTRLESSCFNPLGTVFRSLQKKVDFPAANSSGETVRIRAAKMVSVIKGDPDPVLRRTTGEGLAKWYGAHAELYAALLNEMHGFRLTMFDTAGVDPLSVSLAQNRMSREALDAIRTAILSRIDEIRETVSVRAPFLGTERPGFCDLMAPAPVFGSSPARTIPYPEGIGIVREALGTVNPAMSDFIGMMLEKGWIDAEPSDKKIGGAFYSRFNEFRMPRVFSSYMGSITSVLQQSHELGHSFHYWTMRDLPMIETEFPMTLTETASTFNEAVVRRHLLSKAEGAERFAMLWQDLRSAANFLMNTMVRMDFELEFLKRRQAGVVSAGECCELMNEAWKRWYGETAEPDTWLWAYKLHYYKTDQFIYNYPYTVGYLMSMLLIDELEKRGNGFYDFYVGMLRDTGRMTLDDIIARHFEGNASDPGLWGRAVSRALRSLPEFQKVVKSMPACSHC